MKLCLDWEDILFLYDPDETDFSSGTEIANKIRQWNKVRKIFEILF